MTQAMTQLTINEIPAATTQSVISVRENDSLDRAITLMRVNNFSQLPVLSGRRDEAVGVVSWRSVARALLTAPDAALSDCVDKTVRQVRLDGDLISEIAHITDDDYVLVVDDAGGVSGIVTSADLGAYLAEFAEPYLLLSRCEDALRNLINHALECGVLTREDVALTMRSTVQKFEGKIENLPFGDLVNVLEHDGLWDAVTYRTDRKELCQQLNKVAQLRNQVMHFRDGVDELADVEARLPYIIREVEAVTASIMPAVE